MMSPTRTERRCRSGRGRAGTLLIGIVGDDGKVRDLGGAPRIDGDVIAAAGRGRTSEGRSRFSEPCAGSASGHWTGHDSGLVDRLLQPRGPSDPTRRPGEASESPHCGIRSARVSFHRRGVPACRVRPAVIHTRHG